MAAGDFVSATVGTEGWYADLVFSGLGTGGTYANGLTGNNVPTAPIGTIHKVCLGFDTTGAATTRAVDLYITASIRTPYDTRSIAGSYTTGTFVEGETITQAVTGATAVVVIGASAGPLLLADQWTGSPNNSGIWTGGTSLATFTPSSTPAQWGASASSPGPREFYDGTNTTIRMALSDYVFQKDNTGGGNSGTACTIDLLSGLYTKSGTPTGTVTAGAVTNNSTAAYPKVVGNWLSTGYIKVGATSTMRCVAFHRDARDGKPVACVIFTESDAHSNTVTTTVTDMTIDTSLGDAMPIPEYAGTVNTSGFTQNDIVTRNFAAYPWIGDSNSVLDTSTGTAAPTPLYGPLKAVADPNGTYAQSVAVVDPAGNDGTGVVSTVLATAAASPYLTIKGAYDGVRAYNNTNYSRNNCGGSTIYLQAGTYAWMGGTPTVGTAPDAFLTITAYPGVARSSCIIGSQSGGRNAGLLLRITNVKINAFHASGIFDPNSASAVMRTDGCEIDTNDATNNPANTNYPMFYRIGVVHMMRNLITNLNNGLKCFSTTNSSYSVIRGNTISPTVAIAGATPFVFIGNRKTNTLDGCHITDNTSGQTWPTMTNQVIAYNYMSWANNGGVAVGLRLGTATETHGLACVQNVLENTLQSGPAPLLQIAADGSTGTPVNNVLLWHNVLVGQRMNGPYNDSGSAAAYRQYWSFRNNYYDNVNVKTDTFAPANANRIGNWAAVYGSGANGEVAGEITGIGAPGVFKHAFIGINSYQPAAGTNAATYPKFVLRGSANGSVDGGGQGDYRITLTSPLLYLGAIKVLPYDLAGNPRVSGNQAAGAYNPYDGGPGFWFP